MGVHGFAWGLVCMGLHGAWLGLGFVGLAWLGLVWLLFPRPRHLARSALRPRSSQRGPELRGLHESAEPHGLAGAGRDPFFLFHANPKENRASEPLKKEPLKKGEKGPVVF